MKKYSALVKDGDRIVFIENQEYHTKADFIKDLRCNGYQVNPRKVKPSDVFDYIMNHTNCNPWDWDIKAVPAEWKEKDMRELAVQRVLNDDTRILYNPRPRKEYAEEMPGRPVLINGYWHIEWTPARTGHQAITPYGWPTREQAERAIAAHK